jgi:hypothetical protein
MARQENQEERICNRRQIAALQFAGQAIWTWEVTK